jgi:xylulokinase
MTGYMEIDLEEVYENVSGVLRQISKGLKADDVILSLSCMAPVLILIGKSSKQVRPAILYNDLRAFHEVDELNARIGVDRLLRINGNRANVQQWGPKLLWLSKHEPSTISKVRRFYDLSTYLVWRLTGEECIDYSVAEEGGLLDHSKLKWSDEMLSQLEIEPSKLPSLKPTKYYCEITPHEKSKMGFSGRRAYITVGCVDAVVTPLAVGLLKEGRVSIELGTTGIIYAATRRPTPDPRLYLDFSPVDGLYYVGGGTAGSGIFYDWIVRLLLKGKLDYNTASRLAAASSPGSKGVVVLPYLLGEMTPVFDMLARAVIFGMTLETTTGDILRGAMEAVAYSLLHNLKIMRDKGFLIESGSVTGGGARSALFRKIIGDVMGLPVTYNRAASTLTGAAYIGYMAAGIKKKWEEIEEWLVPDEQIMPDPSLRQTYDSLFAIYLNLYEKHQEDFKTVAKV